jgi:hypothetical protein
LGNHKRVAASRLSKSRAQGNSEFVKRFTSRLLDLANFPSPFSVTLSKGEMRPRRVIRIVVISYALFCAILAIFQFAYKPGQGNSYLGFPHGTGTERPVRVLNSLAGEVPSAGIAAAEAH